MHSYSLRSLPPIATVCLGGPFPSKSKRSRSFLSTFLPNSPTYIYTLFTHFSRYFVKSEKSSSISCVNAGVLDSIQFSTATNFSISQFQKLKPNRAPVQFDLS
ncbi:hypothetical protein RIF29_38325 [Crotalaria pallida]|uniref:Uncharacterized protein n=1 Tax=Crotalaria pallida TaxID=3830 RepID=A0AAN9HNU3_CROPI